MKKSTKQLLFERMHSIGGMPLRETEREKFNSLYHGTDLKSALEIKNNGVDISKGSGGYFGWGFYTTPDFETARDNYGDFGIDTDEKGAVVEVKPKPNANILDMRNSEDSEIWSKYANHIGDKNLHRVLVRNGIDGLYDNSFEGVVFYNPNALEVVKIHPVDRKHGSIDDFLQENNNNVIISEAKFADLAKSLFSLAKYNNGEWKSDKQKEFILSQVKNPSNPLISRDGNYYVYHTGNEGMYGNPVNFQIYVDDEGVHKIIKRGVKSGKESVIFQRRDIDESKKSQIIDELKANVLPIYKKYKDLVDEKGYLENKNSEFMDKLNTAMKNEPNEVNKHYQNLLKQYPDINKETERLEEIKSSNLIGEYQEEYMKNLTSIIKKYELTPEYVNALFKKLINTTI